MLYFSKNTNAKILVVVPTARTHKSYLETEFALAWQKIAKLEQNYLQWVVVAENSIGLSKLYNTFLEQEKKQRQFEFIVFVHDDVLIEDLFFVEKIVSSPFGISGVAGTKTHNKKAENRSWHLASSPSSWVGEVRHHSSSQGTFTSHYGPLQGPALIVDGLLLSCHCPTFIKNNLMFDEKFDWHFYDLALCLRAYKKRVSVGTIPLHVVHYGLGDSMLTEEWKKAHELFKRLYA